MKHLLKRFPFNVLLLLIFVVVVIVVHSCRRDIVHPNSSVAVKTLTTHGIDISKLQAAYQQGTSAGKLKTMDVSSQAMANIISTLNVDWSSYTLQEFADSSKIIEFPMPDDTTLIAPRDSLQNGHKKYASKTAAVFILHKDTIVLNFFMKTVEDQNNPNYQSVINQLHYLSVPGGFNGEVLYFTLGRQFINGYLWKGGSITKAISLTSVTTPPTPQSQSYKGKLKVDEIALTNCTIEYYDVVWITTVTYGNNPPVTTVEPTGQSFSVTTCDVSDSGGGSGGTTSGGVSGGGGATPTPVPCVPASAPAMTSVKSGRLVVDVAAGGSGSTGSSGGTSTPVPCPTTGTTPTPTPKDPCQEKTTVSTMEANSIIANQNAQILAKSTSIEYGTNQNLTSLTSNTYVNTPVTTSGNSDSFDSPFTWDSTAGYTIGSSHGHPGQSAPSPDDVFWMIGNLSNSSLVNAGTSAIQFYRNNASITVVTQSNTYVVTVNDWGKLQTEFTKFNASPVDPTTHLNSYDQNYVDLGLNYEKTNQGSTDADAGLYALMAIFGSAINIYKAPTGSTNYVPVTLNTTGQVAQKQCP
jgi:hypothetical protein